MDEDDEGEITYMSEYRCCGKEVCTCHPHPGWEGFLIFLYLIVMFFFMTFVMCKVFQSFGV